MSSLLSRLRGTTAMPVDPASREMPPVAMPRIPAVEYNAGEHARRTTDRRRWQMMADLPPGITCNYTDSRNLFTLNDSERRLCVVLETESDRYIGTTEGSTALRMRLQGFVNNLQPGKPVSFVDVPASLCEMLNFPDAGAVARVGSEAQKTPAEKRLVELLEGALRLDASDVHLDGNPEEKVIVRIRRGGTLEAFSEMSYENFLRMAINLHTISGENAMSSTMTNDAAIEGKVVLPLCGRSVEVRWQSMPHVGTGLSLYLRFLGRGGSIPTLSDLGYSNAHCAVFDRWICASTGLILTVGATGSGKSTTQARLLTDMRDKRPGLAIHTIEDPVEYRLPGIVQRNVTKGTPLITLLKGELRCNPNVLVVGETRDVETALEVMKFVSTGHLMLTTLHVSSPEEVIKRFRNMSIPADDLGTEGTIQGIFFQSLVRKVCPDCGIGHDQLPAKVTDSLYYKAYMSFFGSEDCSRVRFERVGANCPLCKGTGAIGRTVVASLLEPDLPMRALIAAEKLDALKLYRLARLGICENPVLGMTAQQHCGQKVLAGEVCPITAQMVVGLFVESELRSVESAKAALKAMGEGNVISG